MLRIRSATLDNYPSEAFGAVLTSPAVSARERYTQALEGHHVEIHDRDRTAHGYRTALGLLRPGIR
jgi:hypothetical protein